MTDLKPKDRMKIPRQAMPHQEADVRRSNFDDFVAKLKNIYECQIFEDKIEQLDLK